MAGLGGKLRVKISALRNRKKRVENRHNRALDEVALALGHTARRPVGQSTANRLPIIAASYFGQRKYGVKGKEVKVSIKPAVKAATRLRSEEVVAVRRKRMVLSHGRYKKKKMERKVAKRRARAFGKFLDAAREANKAGKGK